MRLISITLNNIRSYREATITFPEGSTLLSGDIGAGKSTVLLAIEFALFGVIRGSVDGASLLRHGETSGFVELQFEMDNKQTTIRRNLKRNKTGVKQEAGYIVSDQGRVDCTPVELKSRILEQLGYPQQLLTKSKELIYRYTVYTPQESMKHILSENSTERLNTLRRVFQIEKYKVIRENTQFFSRQVRQEHAVASESIKDLPLRQQEKATLQQQIKEATILQSSITPQLTDMQNALQLKIKTIEEKEKELESLNQAQAKLNVLDAQLAEKQRTTSQLSQELARDEQTLKELSPLSLDEKQKCAGMHAHVLTVKEQLQQLTTTPIDQELKQLQDELNPISLKLQERTILLNQSQQLVNSIASLQECTVCKQSVTEEHKHSIKSMEEKKQEAARTQLTSLETSKKEIETKILASQERAQKIQQARIDLAQLTPLLDRAASLNIGTSSPIETTQSEFSLAVQKFEQNKSQEQLRAEKEKSLLLKKQQLDQVMQESVKIAAEKAQITISPTEEKKQQLTQLKRELDVIREHEKELLTKKASVSKEIESTQTQLTNIETIIQEKEKGKEKISKLATTQNWLQQYYTPLMELIEKQVMLKIYHQFNEFFQTWFDILMEDDTISARLDDTFSPIVEQNGYETTIDQLSGGEKTSCALAYRLALNKVINDLVEGIRTKDILILDEPTDGFSNQQLEKIRDVLDQLQMKQTLIVSHEPQVESFVDHVLRIHKQGGASTII